MDQKVQQELILELHLLVGGGFKMLLIAISNHHLRDKMEDGLPLVVEEPMMPDILIQID